MPLVLAMMRTAASSSTGICDESRRQPKTVLSSIPYRPASENPPPSNRRFSSRCVDPGPARRAARGRQRARSARAASSGARGATALSTTVVMICAPTTAAHCSVKSANGPAKTGTKLAGPVVGGRALRTASMRAYTSSATCGRRARRIEKERAH
jgi:hypothetical protein